MLPGPSASICLKRGEHLSRGWLEAANGGENLSEGIARDGDFGVSEDDFAGVVPGLPAFAAVPELSSHAARA